MKSLAKQSESEGLPESLIGNVIENRYKIERFLAAGNFGYVYEAQHQILGHPLRRVAVKLLKKPGLKREQICEDLKDALVVASLAESHSRHDFLKNIVHIYDIGICESWNSRGYVIMEYISGDLQKEIRGSKGLPVHLATDYAKQICRGVGLAHSCQPPIVHRDLKPANVLITANGLAKVTDFGLAKAVGFSSGTTEGAGDMNCQAPESLEGTCTTRSDVYSIGLILYEMLTGEHPFDYLSEEILIASSNEKISEIHKKARKRAFYDMREKNPILRNYPEICRIVALCSSYDPEARMFTDANSLLRALEDEFVNEDEKKPKESETVLSLLKKAKAVQHDDPGQALKFLEEVLKSAKPERHRPQLMEAYYLKGRVLGTMNNPTRDTIDQAQRALFTAHKDYGHPQAADLRRQLLMKIGNVI